MSVPLFIPVMRRFGGVIGPSALTQRWVYTVPAGKRAEVRYMYVLLQDTAPQAFGISNCFITVTIGGVALNTLVQSTRAAVGEYSATVGPIYDLSPGDLIEGYTTNGGATNLVYVLHAIMREYQ